ncbi:MAG: DedA family protein [Actinomycetota bacterium]|nr:VTT domain-containing protein [Actinomycetota bacterium]
MKIAERKRAPRNQTMPERWKVPLLALSVVRIALGIVAIPLAPALYRKHYLILVLLRPTKDVLLFGGFLARQHKVNLLHIVAAAIPLAILGVWHAFAVGRAHKKEIRAGKIPGIGAHIIHVKRVKTMQKVLKKKGAKLVLIGRLAVFPSAALGMAAGASGMRAREFMGVDLAGGLISVAEALGAGFILGGAYKSGKHWITFAGVAALIAFGILLGRYIRRE